MPPPVKLPTLPVNWKEQPQLFETYWSNTMKSIEDALNGVITAQAAADGAQTSANGAQNTADSATAAAAAAQATADAAVPQTRQILTTGGLTGGGALNADLNLSIANVGTPNTYTFTVGLQSIAITTNAKGQVTNIIILP